ncbi:MAG: hypothetical protein HY599_02585 [Candidatus Omnitrophica bacterium]|nr:hypothetical protein [Candidatus Omnitrophota bacterium]
MHNQRGMVFLMSMGVIVLFTVAGASMLLRSLSEARLSERSRNQVSALHLADAGVDQAAVNLRTPTDAIDDVLTRTFSTGSFQLDPAVSIGADTWRVESHGTSDQDTGYPRHVEAVFRLTPQSVFQFALFGDQQVNVSGSAVTDSYDSSAGAYDPDDPSHNGDVGTNATNSGGVTVNGSIFVDGQVAVGPDVSDPVSVVTGYDPAFITGGTDPPSDTQDVVAQGVSFPMPSVVVPVGLTCNDFEVSSNDTVTLPPGTYCYQNLTLQGGGTLTASGDVTIYITGLYIARGNSTTGVPSNPKSMLIMMAPTGDATIEQGTITGSTGFYGALYAPDSTINVTGNAEVYGSIIAERVNVSGSAAIHYDESLQTVTQISNLHKVAVVSWREL